MFQGLSYLWDNKSCSDWLNKDNCHKLHALSNQQRTYGPTNQPTDGLTNRAAYRVACTRLKNQTTNFNKNGVLVILSLMSLFYLKMLKNFTPSRCIQTFSHVLPSLSFSLLYNPYIASVCFFKNTFKTFSCWLSAPAGIVVLLFSPKLEILPCNLKTFKMKI